jgi:hypothetical protein
MPENPRLNYYLALASVGGRSVRSLVLEEVRSIERRLDAAIRLGGDFPELTLLRAMIKHDYYQACGLTMKPPSARALLLEIRGKQADKHELERLWIAAPVQDATWYQRQLAYDRMLNG